MIQYLLRAGPPAIPCSTLYPYGIRIMDYQAQNFYIHHSLSGTRNTGKVL